MADGQFEVHEFLLPMHLIANRAWCKIFISHLEIWPEFPKENTSSLSFLPELNSYSN